MSALDTILNAMTQVFPTFARSNGSVEAKLIDVVASYADSEAAERQNTLNVISQALTAQKVTRRDYYRRKAVEYQEGDVLSYDSVNQGAFYEVVDETKRLVKQAYIVGEFPLFTLLVNALDTNTNHLRKLTSGELAAFAGYFDAFQPIGMNITVQSLDVAQIYDDNMVIYVRAGSDLQSVLDNVKASLLAHEVTPREFNEVTLTEIESVIRANPNVIAVGWNDPYAEETLLSGDVVETRPVLGVFALTTGVFTFATNLQLSNIKTLQ
jgi:hypothetical protein